MVNQTKNFNHYMEVVTNTEIINYLYFLLDKVDPAYFDEISKSIFRFISKLERSSISHE
jgi:hypothetical protein